MPEPGVVPSSPGGAIHTPSCRGSAQEKVRMDFLQCVCSWLPSPPRRDPSPVP
jgi:hypothetical protein